MGADGEHGTGPQIVADAAGMRGAGKARAHAVDQTRVQGAGDMTAEYFDDKKLCWLCPEGKDNHFWDCEVMALVAAYELDLRNWKRPTPRPRQTAQTPRGAAPTPHSLPGSGARPDWFNQRRCSWTRRKAES